MACNRYFCLLANFLACFSSSALAYSGHVYGQVDSALGGIVTTGEVLLTINGIPWGSDAPIDSNGAFDFGTVVWSGGATATCQLTTSGTGLIDQSQNTSLADGGSSNVPFLLSGSTISGIITDADSAQPIPLVTVMIYDSSGASSGLLGSAQSDVTGAYKYTGLKAGSYFGRTNIAPEYVDLIWMNTPCILPGNCPISSGTPIVVPDETSVIDASFQLHRDRVFDDGFGP